MFSCLFILQKNIPKILLFSSGLPVLFITNTTNPLHLYASAKKTADAMINAKVEFVPIENCGLIAMDAKEKGLQIIESFLQKHA